MQIEIVAEAENDLLEAMIWYDTQSEGLGLKFFAEIERSLSQVSLNPELGRTFFEELRRIVMSKFPFCIYYCIEREKILFLAFVHAHRDTSKISNWLRARMP